MLKQTEMEILPRSFRYRCRNQFLYVVYMRCLFYLNTSRSDGISTLSNKLYFLSNPDMLQNRQKIIYFVSVLANTGSGKKTDYRIKMRNRGNLYTIRSRTFIYPRFYVFCLSNHWQWNSNTLCKIISKYILILLFVEMVRINVSNQHSLGCIKVHNIWLYFMMQFTC